MELAIVDTCGLQEGSILSVRSGPTRRQSPLPCVAPFRLPAGPWPLRIDVLGLLGKSGPSASLANLDSEGRCRVPLEARDGRKMSVTLQVIDTTKAALRPKTAPEPDRKSLEEAEASGAVRRRDTEAEARAYLDRHRLHEFMHALFELLLRERPVDPYTFIATRFQEAAILEAKCPVMDLNGYQGGKVSRSTVSTAPTSTIPRELPAPVPEGMRQVVVRSIRGRALAKFLAKAEESVDSIKSSLESSLGAPAAAIQLLWWGETLTSGFTLEDYGVMSDNVTLHAVVATREPRLLQALTGSSEGGLRVWNLENGELIRDFACGGSSAVLAVALCSERPCALTGTFDGRLRLWNLTTGACERELQAHSEEVYCIEVDWDSQRAVTGSSDTTAKLWDIGAGTCLQIFQAGYTVWTLSVDWCNGRLCGGLRNGSIRLWDFSAARRVRDFNGGKSAAEAANTSVSGMAIDCAGRRAVSGFEDGHLAYWHFGGSWEEDAQDSERGQETSLSGSSGSRDAPSPKLLLAHYTALRTIVGYWGPDGSRAICGSDDGSLSLWRLETQECLARFVRHIGFVWAVHVDWRRERLLSGAFDGCMKLWDLRTGECLRTIQSHSRPVRSVTGGV